MKEFFKVLICVACCFVVCLLFEESVGFVFLIGNSDSKLRRDSWKSRGEVTLVT